MKRHLLAVWIILAAAPALCQTAADLSGTVDEAIGTEQATQELRDEWAAEKAALENRYRAARGNVDWLRDRLRVEKERAAALDDRVAELARRLDESGRLQASIQDTMMVLQQRLEDVVAADLPFLAAERQARLQSVRSELARPEVNSAEKLRRLLEALLVEAQYGETVEVSQEKIDLAGRETFVDMLRIGRLAMFWRTPDGAQIGTWDPVTRTHVLLPAKDSRTMQKAMEMATRMRPVQLLPLPLGRIQP